MTNPARRFAAGGGATLMTTVQIDELHRLDTPSRPKNQALARMPGAFGLVELDGFIRALCHLGTDRWRVMTLHGAMNVTTAQLMAFPAFRLQALRQLVAFFPESPSREQWLRFVRRALEPLRAPRHIALRRIDARPRKHGGAS